MEFLKELMELNEKVAKPKVTTTSAKGVYRRDYLKTKNKEYRKYDAAEHVTKETE